MSAGATTLRGGHAIERPRMAAGRLAREQALVAGAQVASGVGNLAFAIAAARMLAPGAFAQLVAFLALYLLVHVPASSLSAGSALSPALAARGRRRALGWGAVAAGALALTAVPLATPAGVPAALLLVLAAGIPAAPWLALERGRLYGSARHGRAAASLAIEPVVRLALGLPLLAALGAVGGAAGVVLGGWAALAVTRPGGTTTSEEPAATRASARLADPSAVGREGSCPTSGLRAAGLATAAFLLLALVQNQDVVLANGLLAPGEAGRFAVLSTLGGVAAFATTTIPLVLLPRARADEAGALRTALLAAAVLGALAVGAVALVPSDLVAAAFGDRYASVGPLAVPYVAAMALFGIARVLVAHRVARGGGRGLVAALGAVAAAHLAAVAGLGEDASTIAAITLAAMGALALATSVPVLRSLRLRERSARTEETVAEAAAWPAQAAATTPAAEPLRTAVTTPAPEAPPAPAVRPPPAADDDGASPADRVPDPAEDREPSAGRPGRDAIGPVPTWVAITALALVAVAVRLLATRGIWLDEATSITQAQLPLSEMLELLRTTDVHPPLHHVLLWGMAHSAGTSELAMRVPSLVAGVATVVVLYHLGRELYDRRAGLLAAALATIAPFLVWYSQEARMYALFMLFAVLAVYGQMLVLRRGRVHHWALYAVATAGLLWTQYFGVLFVGVQQLGFLIAGWSRRRAGRRAILRGIGLWLAATLLIAAAMVPLAPFALDQFEANQAAGRGFDAPSNAGDVDDMGRSQPGVYVLLTNFVWAIWGYHSSDTMAAVTALWPLGMLAALLLLGRGRRPLSMLVLACAVLPAAALFAVGYVKPFLFEIRYFAGAVPLLVLLLARAATGWIRGTVLTALVSTVILGTFAVAFADQQLNRSNPRLYDFEGALGEIERRARPGDVVLYQPPYMEDLIRYYAPELRSGPLEEGTPRRGDAGRVFLLSSFLNEPQHARATGQGLAALDREWDVQGSFRKPQVRVWVFGK